MTRKKWNRLRRTRPELFSKLPPWEKMNDCEKKLMKRVSVTQAVTRMHAVFISDYEEFTWPDYRCNPPLYDLFPTPGAAHPQKSRPLAVPGLAGKLWTPDPAFPPQSWEKLEESLRKQSAALDKALADPANHPPVEVGQDCVLVEGKFHVEQSPAMPLK